MTTNLDLPLNGATYFAPQNGTATVTFKCTTTYTFTCAFAFPGNNVTPGRYDVNQNLKTGVQGFNVFWTQNDRQTPVFNYMPNVTYTYTFTCTKTKNIGLGHFGGIATANARVLTENPNDDTYYAETYKEASSTAAIFDVYNNGQ